MLSFGWFPLVSQFPNLPGPLKILQLLYQKHKSQLVQSSLSCSIVFSILWQGRGIYLSFHILSVLFCGQLGQQSQQFCKFSFFVCCWKLSFSKTGAGLYIYHLLVWSNLNFLHIFQWITLPTQSCLILYSFCANLLHSLIMWSIVSSLSPHNLYLLFYWVLFILALIWLVLMALFCAAVRRDSASLLKFPFLCNVLVLFYEMLFISHLKRP